MPTADDGASKPNQAMVVRGDDSLAPPSVRPIATTAGEPLDTVCGVPLETGERVVMFYAADHKVAKWIHIVLGVIFLVAIFGLLLILYGVYFERWHLKFVAITDRRVILQKGDKPARWLYLKEVIDLRAKRASSSAPGVVGVVATAANEAKTALATKSAKTDPKFWAGTEAVVVQGKKGALSIDQSVPPTLVGPALANALYTDGWIERLPTANYPR